MDRPHDMDAVRVAQAVPPVLGRAAIDVSDFVGPVDRSLAELVRERRQPFPGEAERAETGRGHADVEADRLGPAVRVKSLSGQISAVVNFGTPSVPATVAAMKTRGRPTGSRRAPRGGGRNACCVREGCSPGCRPGSPGWRSPTSGGRSIAVIVHQPILNASRIWAAVKPG